MKSQQFEAKALELFSVVIDLPEDQRADWLKSQCQNDVDLLSQVSRLVEADAMSSQMFPASRFASPPIPKHQGQVGPYALGELIGEGGMGAVYRAERTDGAYQRTVAIKLLRINSSGSLARFDIERQIMANLVHANIAQLLDGGSIDGQPFIVMEYIEGKPFCYQPEVSITETLRQFMQVCDAVDYAHNHLVLHRDIKPSNILLTNDGLAKLLDFGVAKLLGELDVRDLTSVVGLPQTPAYASPECLVGYVASVRSEVYSLGVLLREVTTGERPYKLAGLSGQEARDEIIKCYPLSQSNLPGDLSKIIAKAMAPDPNLRYSDVASLAADVDAFLSNRPIMAQSQTWSYVARRFVQRHATAVALATIGLVGLITALTISIDQTAIARAQLHRANTIAEFLNKIVNAPSNRYTGDFRLGPDATMIQVLASAGEELRRDPNMAADVKVELHCSISEALSLQRQDDAAVAEGREALRISATLPPSHNAVFLALHNMASVLDIDGRVPALAEGREFIAKAMEWLSQYEPHNSQRLSYLYGELGYNQSRFGNHDQAILAYQKSLQLLSTVSDGPPANPFVGLVYGLLGESQLLLLKHDEAAASFRQSLEVIEALPGNVISYWDKSYLGLAMVLLAKHQDDEAYKTLSDGLVMSERDSLRDPLAFRFVAGAGLLLSQLGYAETAIQAMSRLTPVRDSVLDADQLSEALFLLAAADIAYRSGATAQAKTELHNALLLFQYLPPYSRMTAHILSAEIALSTPIADQNAVLTVHQDLDAAQELIKALNFESSTFAQKIPILRRRLE